MRVRALTGPIIFAALLATTPQLAFGQDEGERSVSPTPALTFNARPGTEISSDELGEFLAKTLTVNVSYPGQVLRATLRVEMISREEGVIGKWESEAVEVEGGKTYPCVKYFCRADEMNEALAPGFGDRRKITFGRFVVINHEEQYIPRECERATHALRIDVGQGDGVLVHKSDVDGFLCLNVER
jgi:hypothetical protein